MSARIARRMEKAAKCDGKHRRRYHLSAIARRRRRQGEDVLHLKGSPKLCRSSYMFRAAAVFVAQTASLLFRRMSSCSTAPWRERLNSANALPIDNRRYSRLSICPTLLRYVQPPKHWKLFCPLLLLHGTIKPQWPLRPCR